MITMPPPPQFPPPYRKADAVYSLLLFHGLWGAILGVVFTLGILVLDVAHIRSLAFASPDGMLAIGMLTTGSIITFSAVVMGSAVMHISHNDDDEPRGGHRARTVATFVPIPLRVNASGTRR